jgi:hypothetical protein
MTAVPEALPVLIRNLQNWIKITTKYGKQEHKIVASKVSLPIINNTELAKFFNAV